LTDALLFLHLLSAAALVAAVAGFTAAALGARYEVGSARAFTVLWRAGILGVIVFGIALAIDIDGYAIWDAWVLIAIAIWLVLGAFGDRVAAAAVATARDGTPMAADVARGQWILVVLVLLLLADMIWKPWA
jgi:hypothetical protein